MKNGLYHGEWLGHADSEDPKGAPPWEGSVPVQQEEVSEKEIFHKEM